MTSTAQSETLEGLLALATPGPWWVEAEAEPEDEYARVYICHPKTVCDVTVVATMGWSPVGPAEHADDDADLIVAAVNALPDLLVTIAAQAARIADLEAQVADLPAIGIIPPHKDYPCEWRPMTGAEVRERMDAQDARIVELEAALTDIFEHFADRNQAPGHCHDTPGIWDDDSSNADRAGTLCDWCAKWNRARAALQSKDGSHG